MEQEVILVASSLVLGFALVFLNIFPSLCILVPSLYFSYLTIQKEKNLDLWLYYWMFFASTEVFDGMFSGILRDIFPKYIFLKYIFQCALIGGLVVYTSQNKKSVKEKSKPKKSSPVVKKIETNKKPVLESMPAPSIKTEKPVLVENKPKPVSPKPVSKPDLPKPVSPKPIAKEPSVNVTERKQEKLPDIKPPVKSSPTRIAVRRSDTEPTFENTTYIKPSSVFDKNREVPAKNTISNNIFMKNNAPPARTGGFSRPKSNISMLLDWCKEIANPYKGVSITNWTDSFWDGLAYCAIIDHYHPGVIDFNSLDPKNKQYNLDLAFNTAESLGVAKLLEAEDFIDIPPERRSNITYITQMYSTFTKTKTYSAW